MPLFDFISPFARRPRVSTIPTADTTFGFTGPEGRRSTRIERPVPLLITGHDGLGQEFLERTSAVSLNLHGCRFHGESAAAMQPAIGLAIHAEAAAEVSIRHSLFDAGSRGIAEDWTRFLAKAKKAGVK